MMTPTDSALAFLKDWCAKQRLLQNALNYKAFVNPPYVELPKAVAGIESVIEWWNRGPDGVNGREERELVERTKSELVIALASAMGWKAEPERKEER
jgi:hypothetical protein